ncbi:zinc finger protein AEBP2 isoform X1 [Carcharodon carcharias]|uniref:zinc finger protein AEBP2 isoform X1 n=1 Tax=Carcharodon carcharias TaxID=13397 RepID=UPI001B7DCCA7|nr:zinc finger protein AEBP2 isoform X1 [Carcharodon carcharias]
MAAAAAPSLSAIANDSQSQPATAKSCRSEAKCGGRSQAGRQQQLQQLRRREEEESEPEAGSGPQASAIPPSGHSSGSRAPAGQGSGAARSLQPQQQAARSGLRGGQQQRGREEAAAAPAAGNRRQSLENSSDGEPLSRMDSEDSISSTLMDMDSTISSGRSTPALINGHGSTTSSGKNITYNCCWDQCHTSFSSSPDLADHIRSIHVDGQRGGVFVCLWKGCKVYNTPSTSQSWLQRHMLTHSGDKPFKCVVGGCTASFASQGGLARHVPTHFSQQNSAKVTSQPKVKEESPSKAVMNKRRRLKNKRRRSLPRPHDFFDAQTMDAIRHRAICFNLSTHIESHGNGHSVVFHSTVIARRREDSGKVKVLLHWTPEDILPDVWVNENDRSQLRTKAVHLSKLPQDAALLLDPNIYRTMPQKRLKRRMLIFWGNKSWKVLFRCTKACCIEDLRDEINQVIALLIIFMLACISREREPVFLLVRRWGKF